MAPIPTESILSHDQMIARIQFFRDWMLNWLDGIDSDLAVCEYANDGDEYKYGLTLVKTTIEGHLEKYNELFEQILWYQGLN